MSDDKEYLQKCCEAVDKELPDGHGFIILTFPFENQGDGMVRYASNANREDAVNTMKEWLLTVSPEDWLKHLDD